MCTYQCLCDYNCIASTTESIEYYCVRIIKTGGFSRKLNKNKIYCSSVPSAFTLTPHADDILVLEPPDTYTLDLETMLEKAAPDANASM